MHHLLSLLLFIATALALIEVPHGLPDGLYTGSFPAPGEPAIFNRIYESDLPERDTTTPAPIGGGSRRARSTDGFGGPKDQYQCTQHNVNATESENLYNSWRALAQKKELKVSTPGWIIKLEGFTYWFACRYGNKGSPDYIIPESDLKIAWDSIIYWCKPGRTGWDFLAAPNTNYGVDTVGFGVCENLWGPKNVEFNPNATDWD